MKIIGVHVELIKYWLIVDLTSRLTLKTNKFKFFINNYRIMHLKIRIKL